LQGVIWLGRNSVLIYTPEWETIGQALERIVAAGLPTARAKQALCREISDRKIRIRQLLAPDRRRKLPAGVHEGLLNSGRINSENIDWRRSRPSRPSPAWASSPLISDPRSFLSVVYEVKNLIERAVESIDVRVADVNQVFDISEVQTLGKPGNPPAKQLPNRGAEKLWAAIAAIRALWPKERPVGLSVKDQILRIREWLKDNNMSTVSDRTIKRALSRLRRENSLPNRTN
jgi:hypothetical protein